MTATETFLRACAAIRATGAATKETSYYGPLESLLNAAGAGLKPAVRTVSQLASLGAGHPDLGFFTARQCEGDAPRAGQLPERGVGEVKSPAEPLGPLVSGAQVSKYWARYRQVLVTNLRDWAFVGESPAGQPEVVERFTLADTEAAFWTLCAHPDRLRTGDRTADFEGFLQRCLLRAAPLEAPRDVAWFLASYAREARRRLEHQPPSELGTLRDGLTDALGVRFDGEKGERFFHATVVQTLFYGLFSAWVLWHREQPERTDRFAWKEADRYLHVPVLQFIFEELARESVMRTLHLRDLVEGAANVLDRVQRARFFARFNVDAEAIQYFYEPFLEAYDPRLRKDLGVWYTPPELVRYMVAKVDDALKTHLGVPDGLADERVVVLDPCCGTGAFLVETLRHVQRTLEGQGLGALAGSRLKEAARTRLFGFELLTAPFVVAHLQMGLALRAAGAPLGPDERAAVFLTNALTGWVPEPGEAQMTLEGAFAREAEQARHVKRQSRILVVLGNPPYDGYAGLGVQEERSLSNAYRRSQRPGVPQPQGQGLNDLYVRFFRMAERALTDDNRNGIDDDPGRAGVVCLVSNNSYLDGLSHPALRERLLAAFDGVWIDNLNGDKYKTGKTTPEGDADPSVFSTPSNREGIQVGTAVATLVRTRAGTGGTETVHYRDFWGRHKLAMLDTLAEPPPPDFEGSTAEIVARVDLRAGGFQTPEYTTITPEPALGLPFVPRTTSAGYLDWPTLPELFPASFPGVQTSRDEALVDVDRDALDARMRAYFDPAVSDDAIRQQAPRLMEQTSGFDPKGTRAFLTRRGMYADGVRRYLYRPFDVRWLYWDPDTKLLDRNRADYVPNVFEGNAWMGVAPKVRREYDPPLFSSILGGRHVNENGMSYFPLYLAPDLTSGGEKRVNLSKKAADYLAAVGAAPEDLFYHALAVLHAPAYRAENAGALRQDWPRVPLPATAAALAASAALGRQVAALLNVETPVPGVTTGQVRPELRGIATPVRTDGGQLDGTAGDFAATVRWGYLGHTGQVMPGPGRTVPRGRGEGVPEALGAGLDVYWNDRAAWAAVPEAVWGYTLGSYAVLKKWLSYRSEAVLGRALRVDEVAAFTATARRIAALLLLAPPLDAAYAAVRAGDVA